VLVSWLALKYKMVCDSLVFSFAYPTHHNCSGKRARLDLAKAVDGLVET
jgi:hypothetical protein